LYVGYGDEKTGAIGMVDAAANKRLDDEFKLGAHPESFQLSASGPNIYVNLPDLKQIAVINRSAHSIVRWPLTFESNFPMALDEADHRLFVATRVPPRLAVFDTSLGHLVAALPTVQDSDDLYYESARKRVYVCGDEGCISVFQQEGADHYKLRAYPRIFRKRKEGLRPLPFGCPCPGRLRRRSVDLQGAGLARGTRVARSNVEYVLRKVCHPIRFVMPSFCATGRM
jgi:hypothetical protein